MTDAEKLAMPRHWRIVKQQRKLSGPYFLEDGQYFRSGLSGKVSWRTNREWGFRTRQAAIEGLRSIPETWGGDRSKLLGSESGGEERTRIGNTPICEDCDQTLDHCDCDEDTSQ